MKTLFFFLCLLVCHTLCAEDSRTGPRLQAVVITSSPIPEQDLQKIPCGTPLKLSVKVKNVGTAASAAGSIYVRYSFPEPLDQHRTSTVFQTEKMALPSLSPGQETEISFTQNHRLPSVSDYFKEDWPMRQYEARVIIRGKEETIGRAALSISAHYYQGPTHMIPKQVETMY